MTCRNWPKMMSRACASMSDDRRFNRRIAALFMVGPSVPIATVKTDGTLTRMFSSESAPVSGISIWVGSRSR